jgi:hypothetical protein
VKSLILFTQATYAKVKRGSAKGPAEQSSAGPFGDLVGYGEGNFGFQNPFGLTSIKIKSISKVPRLTRLGVIQIML